MDNRISKATRADAALAKYFEDIADLNETHAPGGSRLPPGWSAGHGVARCRTCGDLSSLRDPLGLANHPECSHEPKRPQP